MLSPPMARQAVIPHIPPDFVSPEHIRFVQRLRLRALLADVIHLGAVCQILSTSAMA
jgi:hypothetical protein